MFVKLLIWLGLKKAEVENKVEEVKADAMKTLDVNKDGKINSEDAKVAVATKTSLDINKDGKVNIDDVKAVANKVKAEVKEKVARKPRTSKTPQPLSQSKNKKTK